MGSDGHPNNQGLERTSNSLRGLVIVSLQDNGWDKGYEPSVSRAALWGTGGVIPLVCPPGKTSSQISKDFSLWILQQNIIINVRSTTAFCGQTKRVFRSTMGCGTSIPIQGKRHCLIHIERSLSYLIPDQLISFSMQGAVLAEHRSGLLEKRGQNSQVSTSAQDNQNLRKSTQTREVLAAKFNFSK